MNDLPFGATPGAILHPRIWGSLFVAITLLLPFLAIALPDTGDLRGLWNLGIPDARAMTSDSSHPYALFLTYSAAVYLGLLIGLSFSLCKLRFPDTEFVLLKMGRFWRVTATVLFPCLIIALILEPSALSEAESGFFKSVRHSRFSLAFWVCSAFLNIASFTAIFVINLQMAFRKMAKPEK